MRFLAMEPKVTPTFFYGAVTAAAIGLSLGLALHGPWEKHAGGPQIWFPSAAAEELAHPDQTDEPPVTEAQLTGESASDDPLLYAGYEPANPLPVTRLAPDRYDPPAADPGGEDQTEAASLGDAERADVDDLADMEPPRYERRFDAERPEPRLWEPGPAYPY